MTRRRPQISISLFPFLAVLVCAMGALILLLLVMTRKIRHEQYGSDAPLAAEVTVDPIYPDRSSEIAALETEREIVNAEVLKLQQEANQLELSVAQQKTSIAALRRRFTDMEVALEAAEATLDESSTRGLHDHISNLRSQQVVLHQRLEDQEKLLLAKQLRLKAVIEATGSAEVRLHEVNSSIVALRKQVHDAEQKAASTGTETIVEFTNTVGTARTPIIVEVSKQGYRIHPTGIVIESKDMEGFPVSDTPLMAAILAVHRERAKGSVTSQPYVLLLVRPDGSEAFYPAQGILANEKIHFGYELIDADRTIAAGESAPTEIAAADIAMAEAYRRREKIYANLRYIAQGISPQRTESPPDPSRRGLTIRSDGTVGPDSRAADQRANRRNIAGGGNFAGGVAPPPGFYERRAAALAAEAVAREKSRGIPEDSGNPSAGFADQLAQSRTSGHSSNESAEDRLFRNAGPPPVAGAASNAKDGPPSLSPPPLTAEEEFAAMMAGTPNPESQSAPTRHFQMPSTTADRGSPSQTGEPATDVPGSPMMDLSKVDKDLLSRLPSTKRPSKTYATPVGVTVFLDANHMTVGQQPTISVTPDSLNKALVDLLQNVDTEVKDAKSTPREEVMPVVKFIVSPGGERWRIPLAGSLKHLGIPSASIYELSPHIETTAAPGRASW